MVVEMINIVKDFTARSTFAVKALVKSRMLDCGAIFEDGASVQGGPVFALTDQPDVYMFGGILCSNNFNVDDLNDMCDMLNEKYYVAPKAPRPAKCCAVCGGTYGLHVAADMSGIACTLCSKCDDGTVSLA